MPEERLGRGAVPDMSLADNALLTAHGAGLVSRGLVRTEATATFARKIIDQFSVKCGGELGAARAPSRAATCRSSSSGARARLDPKVMVVAQPTWGVDIGASQLIRQALDRPAQSWRRGAR